MAITKCDICIHRHALLCVVWLFACLFHLLLTIWNDLFAAHIQRSMMASKRVCAAHSIRAAAVLWRAFGLHCNCALRNRTQHYSKFIISAHLEMSGARASALSARHCFCSLVLPFVPYSRVRNFFHCPKAIRKWWSTFMLCMSTEHSELCCCYCSARSFVWLIWYSDILKWTGTKNTKQKLGYFRLIGNAHRRDDERKAASDAMMSK